VGLKLLLLAATVATAGPPSTNAPASGAPCHEDEDDDAFAGREQERSDLHSEDDDDGDQGPSASPEVAAAAGRRRTANQRCVYADEQKEFVRACRRRFDADPRAVAQTGWVVTPPAAAMTVRASWRPDPAAWWVKSWGGWVPERLFPAQVPSLLHYRAPPCPTCADGGCVNAAEAKWQKQMPRIVLSLTKVGGWFFLDAKTYRCTQCKSPFLASHPDSVAKLPTEIKMQFGLLQGKRVGVDLALARRVVGEWKQPVPSARIAAAINEEWRREWCSSEATYRAFVTARSACELQHSTVAPINRTPTIDPHVVRGAAAAGLVAQQAAASQAARAAEVAGRSKRPTQLSVLQHGQQTTTKCGRVPESQDNFPALVCTPCGFF